VSLRERARLDRLLPGLTLDQRIQAVVSSVHEAGSLDRTLFRDLPADQREPFWYAVGLLRAAHHDLSWYVAYTEALVRQVELRHAWLVSFWLRGTEAQRVLWFLQFDCPEPLTESEHAARLDEARAQEVPVEELAVRAASGRMIR
jgi:hypothetical protein